MKRFTLLMAVVCFMTTANAQTDSTMTNTKADTMRVGNIIIIKKGGKKSKGDSSSVSLSTAPKKSSRFTTNWGIVDIGFSNFADESNYVAATADGFLRNRPGTPDISKDDFKPRVGKSINVNIWFFMQQLNLVKENIGIKYGLGLELNNYRFRSNISFRETGPLPDGTPYNKPYVFRDSVSLTKNKLAADYITVPLMLNFASNKLVGKYRFNVAFGVSGGYLYSQRNKQRSVERGKKTNKGDYDLERFKFSYVAELGLGPVKFYGSYSPQSLFEHSLDMRPFNVGIRLSN